MLIDFAFSISLIAQQGLVYSLYIILWNKQKNLSKKICAHKPIFGNYMRPQHKGEGICFGLDVPEAITCA